jgi:hypothetical protein
VRLWSLHPSLLDARGLVALWREGLLARKVLRGETRGYRHHPQLKRFQEHARPLEAIDCYLSRVLDEARRRGYSFDAAKIRYRACASRAPVNRGQLACEWKHLLAKLAARDPRWRKKVFPLRVRAHPCLRARPGPVEPWERI